MPHLELSHVFHHRRSAIRAWALAVPAVLGLALGATVHADASPSPQPSSQPSQSSRPARAVAQRAAVDPLAGGRWGVANDDALGLAQAAATGNDKAYLGRITNQPRVRWFTSSLPVALVPQRIGHYIELSQRIDPADPTTHDPNTLVQMAFFGIFPRGEAKRYTPMTRAEKVNYRKWIRAAAATIGSTRTAIVLEPDLAEMAPPRKGVRAAGGRVAREHLAAYAAQVLSALPRTSVYLDAGDADWLPLDKAADLLIASGVRYARGFALGATHYGKLGSEIAYTKSLRSTLAKRGYPGKRSVIDTADNGKGYTWTYWHAHKSLLGHDFDNARPCTASTQTTPCDTLGHAPTWNVGSASPYVDGLLWFGRPWLVRQASPFSRSRALAVARTTPYGQANVTGGTPR